MSDQFGNIPISPAQPDSTAAAGPRQGQRRRGSKTIRPEKPRSPRKKAPSASRGGRSWIFRYLLPVIVLVPFCYALAGFWLLPAYLKTSLPERISGAAGLQLSIADLSFNPFTFALTAQGIQIDTQQPAAAAGERRLLRVDRLNAKLAPLSLLRNDLVTNTLLIEGLELDIVRSADNRYNIEKLFAAGRQGTASDIIDFSELPFLFSLNNISIRGGRITFQDIVSATTHTLDELELDLPSLSNLPFETGNLIHPRFSARFNGSKIELTGQAAIADGPAERAGETKLSCDIQDLELPMYFNYLPAAFPFTLAKGKASGKLELSFSRGSAEKESSLSLDFSGRFAGLALAGKDGTFEAAIPDGTLEGSLSPLDRQVNIRKLAVSKPAIKSRATSLPELLLPMLQPAGERPQAGETPGRLERLGIDLLEMTDGSIELAGGNPAKPQSWSGVQAGISAFAWSASPQAEQAASGTFRFSGEDTGSGTIIDWQGDIHYPTALSGPARIDNIAAASLLTLIGVAPDAVRSGSANILGKLEISGNSDKTPQAALGCSETEVTFQNLQLSGGKTPWLEAKTLKIAGLAKKGDRVDLGALSVENGSVAIDSGSLPEPFLALAAKDGRLSLDSLDYTGSITVSRRNVPPLKLTAVLLQAATLRGKEASGDSVLFSAKVNDKGVVKARGTARLSPFTATLNTGFSGIAASALLPWFTSEPVIAGATADISGKGQLSFPGAAFSGDLRLDDAVFTAAGGEPARWKRGDIRGIAYARSPFRLAIEQMDIDAPQLTWQRTAAEKHPVVQFGALLQRLLPEGLADQGTNSRQGGGPPFAITTLNIVNGGMTCRDIRLDPPRQARIGAVQGSISGIALPAATPSSFTFSGTIDQVPFTFNGTSYLLAGTPKGEAKFQATGLPLSAFATYLPPDIGINSRHGVCDAASTAAWEGGRLKEQAQFTCGGVQAVSLESDAALPLALMKNSDGKVLLQASSERELADAGMPLLEHALAGFRRQLVKAKVSPLLLTGSEFSDLVGNEFIEFQPGEFSLNEGGQATLSRFAAFLKTHPYVGLTIAGAADRGIDGEAINVRLELLENQRVTEENQRRKAVWQKKRDAEMERRRALVDPSQSFIEEDLMADFPDFVPLKPAPVAFQEAMLAELAGKRAALARQLLVEQLAIDSSRVRVAKEVQIKGDPDMPANRALFELRAWNPPQQDAAAGPEDRQR